MSEINLEEKDYKLLKKLVVISRSILSNYYCLIELENNGEIDSEEYQRITNELEANYEMEADLYKSIDKIYKIQDYLQYISGFDQGTFENYLFLIFDYNEDVLIKNRIISKLDYLLDTISILEDDKDVKKDYDLEEDEYDEEEYKEEASEDESFQMSERELLAMNKIQISIENDIVNTILKLLDEKINNEEYTDIKHALLEYKYILLYVFGDVEKEWVKDNYKIKDRLLWAHRLLGDFYGLTDEIIKKQVEDYCVDLLTESRELFLSLLDSKMEEIEDVKKTNYFVDLTVFSLIARTCLMFIDDDLVTNFFNVLKHDIEEIESKNDTVLPFITQIISEYKIDYEKPNIIRLAQKRG